MDVASAKLRRRNVWVLAYRAEDVPGEWVAHCLDVDVVMQGPTLPAALSAAIDGVLLVVRSDIERGADPFARRAPQADWEELLQVTAEGELFQRVDPIVKRLEAEPDRASKVAAQFVLFHGHDVGRADKAPSPVWRVSLPPVAHA